MSYQYELVIKEHHLDSYGHVNNATYLALYEEARWELITQRGYTYQHVHKTGLGPVILEVNLKFQKELTLRETIKISFEMVSYEGKIFKLKQQMIKPDGSVASEAIFTGGFFDLKARKLILPNDEWKKAVGLV
ncbi:MAG: acyl-CoA thioesterase [Bdellovibrionaceae bacterium]|nr:acyl-CoA thioesterase [Pseudobdellovibrionaceae bacterium]